MTVFFCTYHSYIFRQQTLKTLQTMKVDCFQISRDNDPIAVRSPGDGMAGASLGLQLKSEGDWVGEPDQGEASAQKEPS